MDSKRNTDLPVSKSIGYWLLIGAFLVLMMIMLGGYTRLSHSGLSMVTWKPVTGFIPPLNQENWIAEFEAYKTSPEYKLRNYNFSLEEFKEIYWPEFLHRLLGRITGIVFIIPFLYFLIRNKLRNPKLKRHLIIIFLLGVLQGFVGWYMVKSGLVDQPAVSHYRLAIHLCLALILYGYLFLVALKILTTENENQSHISDHVKLKSVLSITLVVVILQIIYGAFVAGLKAGLFYPTFPKMGPLWIPHTVTDSIEQEGIMSFFNSPYVVQFVHRWLGILVLLFAGYLFFKSRKTILSDSIRKSIALILLLTLTQVLLGVLTLIHLVPVSLGVLHQLCAVLLLTSVLYTIFLTRRSPASSAN
ncbi:MAG: COX15/CtaA family protein [Crocinitomicaceae bacterium]|nr:COX15/CtaA family protein [Crocinitomicaceae bacterium]